jgi:hypothetical protein
LAWRPQNELGAQRTARAEQERRVQLNFILFKSVYANRGVRRRADFVRLALVVDPPA